MATPEAIQAKFQGEVTKLKEIEKDKEKTVKLRQQLESQLTENQMVKEEMDRLTDDAVVYKLIGPVLVKQDVSEAKQNVSKRLEYIQAEVKRHEASLSDIDSKQESLKESAIKLQQQMQQIQMKAAGRS